MKIRLFSECSYAFFTKIEKYIDKWGGKNIMFNNKTMFRTTKQKQARTKAFEGIIL